MPALETPPADCALTVETPAQESLADWQGVGVHTMLDESIGLEANIELPTMLSASEQLSRDTGLHEIAETGDPNNEPACLTGILTLPSGVGHIVDIVLLETSSFEVAMFWASRA